MDSIGECCGVGSVSSPARFTYWDGLRTIDQVDAAGQGIYDLLEEIQASNGLGVYGPCRLLQAAAFGDIPVDLQNSGGVSQHIAYQHLAAFNDHDTAISAGMHKFPFPAPLRFETRIDVSTTAGKVGLEQAMGDTTKCVLG
jgi:hypothetical protein